MTSQQINNLLEYLSSEEIAAIKKGGRAEDGLSRKWVVESLGDRAGTKVMAARKVYNYIRGNYDPPDPQPVAGGLNRVGDESVKEDPIRGERTIEKIVPKPIRTLPELIESCEIDTDTWEIRDWGCTAWTTPMKLVSTTTSEDGVTRREEKPHVEQNYRVTARLGYKAREVAERNVTQALLDKIESVAPMYNPPEKRKTVAKTGDHLLLLTLPDTHIGKLVDPDLVGASWSIDDALDLHAQAVESLINASSGFDFDRVLVLMGNDIIQIDNRAGTTTKGTPVEHTSTWENQFIAAEDAYRHLIDKAQEIAPVDVMVVHGNHPSHSEFTLGRVMNAWYSNAPHVRVDTSARDRKYFRYGMNLLGGTHGKNEKPTQLPMLMAEECREWWSKTRYHEFHTGDLHHKKKYRPNDHVEIEGVLIRQSPALCPPDTWHVNGGWVHALRSAQAFVYSRERGHAASFSFNVFTPEREFIGLDADAA